MEEDSYDSLVNLFLHQEFLFSSIPFVKFESFSKLLSLNWAKGHTLTCDISMSSVIKSGNPEISPRGVQNEKIENP